LTQAQPHEHAPDRGLAGLGGLAAGGHGHLPPRRPACSSRSSPADAASSPRGEGA